MANLIHHVWQKKFVYFPVGYSLLLLLLLFYDYYYSIICVAYHIDVVAVWNVSWTLFLYVSLRNKSIYLKSPTVVHIFSSCKCILVGHALIYQQDINRTACPAISSQRVALAHRQRPRLSGTLSGAGVRGERPVLCHGWGAPEEFPTGVLRGARRWHCVLHVSVNYRTRLSLFSYPAPSTAHWPFFLCEIPSEIRHLWEPPGKEAPWVAQGCPLCVTRCLKPIARTRWLQQPHTERVAALSVVVDWDLFLLRWECVLLIS